MACFLKRWLRWLSPGAELDTHKEVQGDEEPWDPETPVELPIDGVLDLHHFRPRDVRTLVPEYLRECQARGINAVRIIHGKGRGRLRRSVHALLAVAPEVATYRLAPPERGGWGATLVDLKPRSTSTELDVDGGGGGAEL